MLPGRVVALTENFSPGMNDYVFFTFVISAVAFSAAILLALRAHRWLVYTAFAGLLVLTTAARGGVLSYLVGPTDFNLFVVPYLVYGGFTAFGFWMAGWALNETHPLAAHRKWLYWAAIASALGPLTSPLWLMKIPLNLMWLPQHLLYLLMLLSQMLPPQTWSVSGVATRRLAVAFQGVILVFVLTSAGITEAWLDLPPDALNILSRANVALFVAFMLTLILWQAVATTKAKQENERRALQAAKSEAELRLALVESEKQYEQARSIAVQQRTQLARVSHDLKQPISALRMAVGEMAVGNENTGRLQRAIDYVDELAQTFKQPDEQIAPDGEAIGSGAGGREVVTTLLFAENLQQMFADEARSAGVRLRFCVHSASVRVVPLATLRIFTNLLANALQHAQATQILATFRRRPECLEFALFDNGVGMSPQEKARALIKGGKGMNSAGDGLGLSIVQDLCAAQGFSVEFHTVANKGTVVRVKLPYAS